jgi:hypothetical protein
MTCGPISLTFNKREVKFKLPQSILDWNPELDSVLDLEPCIKSQGLVGGYFITRPVVTVSPDPCVRSGTISTHCLSCSPVHPIFGLPTHLVCSQAAYSLLRHRYHIQQDVPSLRTGIGGNVENSDEIASHSTNNNHSS